ncbi:Nuclear import receptor [Blyttiomyces sp. JEL0837]|nr:Nuclear import receptor [Blyttiomyces sp. JEL0837]
MMSGAAGDTLAILLQAIDALYSPASSSSVKSDADDWLIAFQKTTEAWSVADALIKMDNVNLQSQLFAAQTLKRKKEELLQRQNVLITQNANEVLHMLMVILNTGNDSVSNRKCGAIGVEKLTGSSIIERSFGALLSDDYKLFDKAVDLIRIIIKKSASQLRRGGDASAMTVVQTVYNGLLSVLPSLKEPDEEKLKGFCDIYSAAGESYLSLILENFDGWKSIIEGLLICVSSSDFEVVPLTFNFWDMLAEDLTRQDRTQIKPHFLELYRRLIDIMIKHLHYPADMTWSAEQWDEFREFRHDMGDVLKNCVSVLGEEAALSVPYTMLTGFIMPGAPGGALNPNIPWQSIEAPLFALRTMGRKISPTESTMLPGIMNMLPQLPLHPKVRYATILVIGTYSKWTKMHPEFLPYQMTFISKGFEDAESKAAACQSLSFLCEDCGELMVSYLSQLHPFYMSVESSLDSRARLNLLEGLARAIQHIPVVSSDPSEPDLLKYLELFCLPIAQKLHKFSSMKKSEGGLEAATELEITDAVNQFKTLVSNCCPPVIPPNTVHPCLLIIQGVWPCLNELLLFDSSKVTVAICKVLVESLEDFAQHLEPLVKMVMPGLVLAYKRSQFPSLMWAAMKFVDAYAVDETDDGVVFYNLIESMSQTAFKSLQEHRNLNHASDIIEDYFDLMAAFVSKCPNLFLRSQYLALFVQCGLLILALKIIDISKGSLIIKAVIRELPSQPFSEDQINCYVRDITQGSVNDSALEVDGVLRKFTRDYKRMKHRRVKT